MPKMSEVAGQVAAMPSVRQGVVHFMRAFVDEIEDALNNNDWQRARNVAAEADTHADDIAHAIEANTPGSRQPMTREEAMQRYGLVAREPVA